MHSFLHKDSLQVSLCKSLADFIFKNSDNERNEKKGKKETIF